MPKINLMELAKRRWIEKWSIERLSVYFGRPKYTIKRNLCLLKSGGLGELKLQPQDRLIINESINTKRFVGSEGKGPSVILVEREKAIIVIAQNGCSVKNMATKAAQAHKKGLTSYGAYSRALAGK